MKFKTISSDLTAKSLRPRFYRNHDPDDNCDATISSDALLLRSKMRPRPWKLGDERCTQFFCVRQVKIRWSVNWWSNFFLNTFTFDVSQVELKIHFLCKGTFFAYHIEPRPWFCVKSISASTQRMSLVRKVTHRTHFAPFCFRFDCFITTLETSWHWGRSSFAVHMFLLFRTALSTF